MKKAFEAALEKAAKINPEQASRNCGFKYEGSLKKGFFTLPILDEKIRLSFPHFQAEGKKGKRISEPLVTIAMYHLSKSDGFPLANKWISFSKLPGGQYASAMRSYTSDKLQDYFGPRIRELSTSAKNFGAKQITLSGDLSFEFQVFPKIPVALVFWKGDDEFPESRADFLFDESAPHHLPTDCYAILCSLITSSLIKKTSLLYF